MLLALEGGGFFSSSASGYRKGLTLLLLGRTNEEEKLMRVSPWNHYQLVEDREAESDLQLASKKNRLVRGCTTIVCFGRTAAAGLESPNSLKVGPAKQKEDILSQPPVQTKDVVHVVVVDSEEDALTKSGLKSSLKKPATDAGTEHEEALGSRHTEKRKVQWTDASGGELAEIREFELSDADGSDDEFDNGRYKSCSCMIM